MRMKQKTYFLISWIFTALLFGAAAQADTIRIGTTQSLTGKYKDFGEEQLRGMQMWAHDINARGALLGQRVELVHYDDHSDAKRSAWLYGQLIEKDKVDLLIGPYSSDITLAASTVAEQSNFPMIAAAASAEQIWKRGYKNIFGIDTPSANYMDLAIEEAANRGAKTFALIYSDTEFSQDVAAGVRREISGRGLQLVLDEQYSIDEMDFTALAKKLKNSHADVLLGATYLEDSVAIGKAIGPMRLDVKMAALTVGPAVREFYDLMGAKTNGIVGVVQWLRSVRLPGAQDFAYRYRQKYGYNPGVHAAIGYSTGQVLEAAVRLAGTTDLDKVREHLGSMEFRSLLGLYKVDDTGRQMGKRNYLLQWQEGSRRLVAPKNVAERELIYPRR
jgi:branched-chain amino acid transport system substrate-binding protein